MFIYNLRLPLTAQKVEKKSKQTGSDHLEREETGRTAEVVRVRTKRKDGVVISGLRGLLESQTYEMSESGDATDRRRSKTPLGRLASKLAEQLPEKWSRPQNGNEDYSVDDMLEEVGLVEETKERRSHSSSNGSDSASGYGSVEKCPIPQRTTRAEISGVITSTSDDIS